MDDAAVYTYQGGKKVSLRKRRDAFVVRAQPEELERAGFAAPERVSPSSARVRVADPSRLEQAMADARRFAIAHHAYESADHGQEFLVTDRVLVRFKRDLRPEEVAAFAGRFALVSRAKYSDRDYLFQLTNDTGMNPLKLVVKLMEEERTKGDVENAEHDLNRRVRRTAYATPTDPAYARQWHLHGRSAASDVDPRAAANVEEAWKLLDGHGSAEIVVGVSDDGCKLDHVDLNSPQKFAAWAYFRGARLVVGTDPDADPARMYEFDNSHGTNCCGVIAAELDAAATVGAAPGCRLLPIKWEFDDSGLFIDDSRMLTLLQWISDKVDVLSNSWGIAPRDDWSLAVVDRIRQLAKTGGRRGKGILFLWAAGNDNCPIQHTAAVDTPFDNGWAIVNGSWKWVGVRRTRIFSHSFVGIPGVLHVAALASTAQRSHYSNYGTGIDLCAPTNNVHKYWRLELPGEGITTAAGPTASGSGPTTDDFGGTSSATPLVAGVAALVLSANPELNALEVASILRRTASRNVSFVAWPRTPPAMYDPNPNWDVSPIAPFASGNFANVGSADGDWSPWFGHGRVDAKAAVANAIARRPAPSAQTIRVTSEPNLPIPDDAPSGIFAPMQVAAGGRVVDVKARAKIAHSWIGDLIVRLRAPDGAIATLHDRAGGSQRDLDREWTLADTPALAAMRDRAAQGEWRLLVADLATRDVGVLQACALELRAAASPAAAEDVAGALVPDDEPAGVTRTLQLAALGTIQDVTVAVDITHTWIGDLIVTLTAPSGDAVKLHDRAGGDADNLVVSWSSQQHAGLRALRGKAANGTWKLHVADRARRDSGKLNRWRVEVRV